MDGIKILVPKYGTGLIGGGKIFQDAVDATIKQGIKDLHKEIDQSITVDIMAEHAALEIRRYGFSPSTPMNRQQRRKQERLNKRRK